MANLAHLPEPLVWWHCRQGHRLQVHGEASAVWCGICARTAGYRGTNEMRQVELFPNWPKKGT